MNSSFGFGLCFVCRVASGVVSNVFRARVNVELVFDRHVEDAIDRVRIYGWIFMRRMVLAMHG